MTELVIRVYHQDNLFDQLPECVGNCFDAAITAAACVAQMLHDHDVATASSIRFSNTARDRSVVHMDVHVRSRGIDFREVEELVDAIDCTLHTVSLIMEADGC